MNVFKNVYVYLFLFVLIGLSVFLGVKEAINYIILGLMTFLLILSFYFLITYAYNLVVSLFGFKNLKRDYDIIEDKTKFLLLVAAHNEENVIRETIRNLKEIDYDKNLFEICIVSDNSTDNTTRIAIEENVRVIDTIEGKFEREGVGKPAGLQYALRSLGFDNVKEKYDMVLVLDADNFVSKNILKEVNSQFIAKNKPEVIQTYLDSKNYNSLMSLAYSAVFWTNNKFMQAARYRLKLPNSIGGTGFCVTTKYLIDSGGFNYKTLTEDLEMEIEIILNNGRVLWNDFASIYDEKPDKLKTSMIQRFRWAKGHFYVGFKNFIPLLKMFFKTFNIKYLDKLFFLMTMGRSAHFIIMSFVVLLQGVYLLLNDKYMVIIENMSMERFPTLLNDNFLFLSLFNILLLSYSFLFLPLYAINNKIRNKNVIRNSIAFLYYVISDFVVQTYALIKWKEQSNWVRTPHVKKEIEELEENEILTKQNLGDGKDDEEIRFS
ncbi:glycosyltransferase family 2 protein [Staphylococcus phage vB_StaM_SA1]|nr:glycosyltransferase family 2 protein [Staphylococcus phage vB_StaM_SA1]